MSILGIIILFGLLMSGIALIGGATLIIRQDLWKEIILPLVAFAAGSLIGGAALHMLPSAVNSMGNVTKLYVWLVAGFIFFYALEEFLHFHHSHTHSHNCRVCSSPRDHQHPPTPTTLHIDRKNIVNTDTFMDIKSNQTVRAGTCSDEGSQRCDTCIGIEIASIGSNETRGNTTEEETASSGNCNDGSIDRERIHLTWMILIADALHNFLGGMFVGASFLDSMELGISAFIAAAAHEVPQELGDFAILVHGGWSKSKALLFNFVSALTFPLGGIIAYVVSSAIDVSFMIPFAAGNFLYIGASDLIPEIKHHHGTKRNAVHFMSFVVGVAIMLAIRIALVGW